MVYQLKEINQQQYDTFNQNRERATLLQSYDWAKIKSTWGNLHYGVFKLDQLVGTMLILKKRLPLGKSMLYIPKGPVIDFQPDLLLGLTKELKAIGKKENAVFIKIDPPVLRRAFYLEHQDSIELLNQEVQDSFLQFGYDQGPLTLNLHDTIQPRFQAVVSAEGFGLSSLTKKGRQGVQTAIKRGVTVEIHGIESLPIFASLMEKTAKRQGISLRGESYFRDLLETYPEAFLILGKIDPTVRKQEVEQQLADRENEVTQLTDSQTKKRNKLTETIDSLKKELKRLTEEIEEHGEKSIYISGTLSIPYGQTSELLYAGMDDSFKHYMPAYYTWFTSIEEAFKRGYSYCNLGGVDGHLNDGLIGFKKNFQPIIHEYMGEFDLPTTNKLFYLLIKKAYKIKTKK